MPVQSLTRREGKRPCIYLRFRPPNPSEGTIRVYPGKLKLVISLMSAKDAEVFSLVLALLTSISFLFTFASPLLRRRRLPGVRERRSSLDPFSTRHLKQC